MFYGHKGLYSILFLFLLTPPLKAEVNTPPGGQIPTTQKENYAWEDKPHHISAEVCKECHQDIYQQWQSSIHAQSTALSDPIHGAFYQVLAGDPRQEGVTLKSGKYPVCLKCHAPNAAWDRVTKLDTLAVYDEGISCVNCHLLKTFKGVKRTDGKLNLGIDAYEVGEMLQAPSGKVFTQETVNETNLALSYHPYPMESNPLLRTKEICLGCHDQRNNSFGVPICVTGKEFENSQHFNCQQCHMPVTNGYADHSMAGGHVQAMLKKAIILTLQATPQDKNLNAEVTLTNTLPHNMPTGAPFRNMYIKLTAYDVQGQSVWQNFQTHPLKEDPQSVLMLTLLDDKDQPTVPPKAKKRGQDTTLKPHEKRTFQYTFPSENVAFIRAQLYYDLLWPKLKQKFDSIPAELKAPKIIAVAEQQL